MLLFLLTASEHGRELGVLLFFCPGRSKHKHFYSEAQGHVAVDRYRELEKVRRPKVYDPETIASPNLLFSEESFFRLLHFNFNSGAKLS